MSNIQIATFYRFTRLEDPAALAADLEAFCVGRSIRGTILLATEGLNATIAGARDEVWSVVDHLRADPRFQGLEAQGSTADFQPFQRLRVKVRPEIVTLGLPEIDPARSAGTYVEPEAWNRLLEDPEVLVIDTRNDYEVAIGSFENAVDPGIGTFGELTSWLEDHLDERSPPKIAMFCTGGIRCEKSTALLRERGFDEVYHLRGGILNYLRRIELGRSRWRGACFVFDDRIAVGHGHEVLEHRLCPRCQFPFPAGGDRDCPHCAS